MDGTRRIHKYETGFERLLGCVKIPRLTLLSAPSPQQSNTSEQFP